MPHSEVTPSVPDESEELVGRREFLTRVGLAGMTLLVPGLIVSPPVEAEESFDLAKIFPAANEAERRKRFGVPLAELGNDRAKQVVFRVLGIFRRGDWPAYLDLLSHYDRDRLNEALAREYFDEQGKLLTVVDNRSLRVKFYAADGNSLATIIVFYPKDKVSSTCFLLLKEGRWWHISGVED